VEDIRGVVLDKVIDMFPPDSTHVWVVKYDKYETMPYKAEYVEDKPEVKGNDDE
jgi:hypothetical protein